MCRSKTVCFTKYHQTADMQVDSHTTSQCDVIGSHASKFAATLARVRKNALVRLSWLVVVSFTAAGCDEKPGDDANYIPYAPQIDLFATVHGDLIEETWDVHMIGDLKVGHRRTRTYEIGQSTRKRILRRSDDWLQIRRFGQVTEQSLTRISLETAAGEVQQLAYETDSGGPPRRVLCRVRGDQLVLQADHDRPGESKTLHWSPNNGGLFAIQASYRATPPQPNQTRRVELFLPILDRTGRLELVAGDWEETELLADATGRDAKRRLIRVDAQSGGRATGESYWFDEEGELYKMKDNSVVEVTVRADQRVAMRPNDTNSLDIALDVRVPLERPFPDPQNAKQAVYRIELERDDPVAHFSSSNYQRVIARSDRVAQLIVRSSDTDPASTTDAAGVHGRAAGLDEPASDDEQANRWIQSDDPRIVAFARTATLSLPDTDKMALALEEYVHRTVTTIDFRQVMATASDVVRQRSGDCSELAVLLAAAARAHKLPSRVVVGLVYDPEHEAFVYHMWNEIWSSGRWMPLDATLGLGYVGPDHIKLAHGSLSEDTVVALFMAVRQVAGQLKIELEETG